MTSSWSFIRQHSVSVVKTNQLMLYREVIAVCSQIHTKHVNTVCGQNVELLKVKLCGVCSKQSALKAQLTADVYTDFAVKSLVV